MRIYCPIDQATLAALMEGRAPPIEQNGSLSAIIGVVRSDTPLGDFDNYKSVIELAPGWEMFTPDATARPTLGQAGSHAASPTAILTIYIPGNVADEAVSRAIDRIMDAHPWEVPVIEISETSLVARV